MNSDFIKGIEYRVIDHESVGGISERNIKSLHPISKWADVSAAVGYLISCKRIIKKPNGRLVPCSNQVPKEMKPLQKKLSDEAHDNFWNRFETMSKNYDDYMRSRYGK